MFLNTTISDRRQRCKITVHGIDDSTCGKNFNQVKSLLPDISCRTKMPAQKRKSYKLEADCEKDSILGHCHIDRQPPMLALPMLSALVVAPLLTAAGDISFSSPTVSCDLVCSLGQITCCVPPSLRTPAVQAKMVHPEECYHFCQPGETGCCFSPPSLDSEKLSGNIYSWYTLNVCSF